MTSILQLKEFLDRAKVGFRLERVELGAMTAWGFRDGALSHRSGGFFSIVGLQLSGEEAVLLYQPQSAITGLLTSVIDGERHFLLQARAEPGTYGIAQYGPTIQSTPANYLCVHGGKPTAYVEWFTTHKPGVRIVHDSMQLDLGERYLFKSKRLIIAECEPDIEVVEGFCWAPAQLVSQAVAESAFFNIDLRSLLAVHRWHAEGSGALQPRAGLVRKSLEAPVRSDALAQVMAALHGELLAYRSVDISHLANWTVSDTGIRELSRRQGFDIEYFHVEARGREVASWSQPLVNSASSGHAVLACRTSHGVLEVFVRIARETGLQTARALLPSYLRYPGGDSVDHLPAGRSMVRTLESDEGGRFFQDTSVYEIVMMDMPETGLGDDGVWISIAELKLLLQYSNVCSIQLRGLASLLLGDLDAPGSSE